MTIVEAKILKPGELVLYNNPKLPDHSGIVERLVFGDKGLTFEDMWQVQILNPGAEYGATPYLSCHYLEKLK